MAAILKILKFPYLNATSYFEEIWYVTADLQIDDTHVTKYEIFLNSRWRMATVLKFVF